MSDRLQIPGSDNRLDVREDADGTKRAVCNLITFAQFSVPSKTISLEQVDNLSLNPSNYENAFAIDLAIRHLNERNGSIIKEIEAMSGACEIEFVGEYIDTEDDAVTAARRVASRLDQTESGSNPCALIGATSSFSESIQTSVVANMKGYSVVSGMNHGIILSHKNNFPRFVRTLPSNLGPANALIRYMHEELPSYRYLVILTANTQHSSDYLLSVRSAISSLGSDKIVTREIFVQQDGSNVEDAITRLKDLKFTMVLALFEGIEYRSNLYDVVMKEAYRQGVAGDGQHIWYFPESLLEYSDFVIESFRNPEYRDEVLTKAYQGSGIIKSGGLGSKYSDLVEGITMQSKVPGHKEFMQSVLPNFFEETNSNATRRMMNEQWFLNENTLDSRIQFLYEATVLLGLSACRASTDDLYLSGDDLHDTLFSYNFSGTSGDMILDQVSGSRDRKSTSYSMMNIQATGSDRIELRHTATITSETVYPVQNKFFVYSDGSTSPPAPVWKTKVETQLGSTTLIAFASILCVIAVTAALVSAIWTYRNRKCRIIRASQSFFLYLICIGSALIALTISPLVALASVKLTQSQGRLCCSLTVWFGWVGLSLLVSSFYAKLYRINKVMRASHRLKRVTIRIRDAILPVSALPCQSAYDYALQFSAFDCQDTTSKISPISLLLLFITRQVIITVSCKNSVFVEMAMDSPTY